MTNSLHDVMAAIDWTASMAFHTGDGALAERFMAGCLRIALWSKQLENIDQGNPALSFLRESQLACQYVPTLTALSLYKPAAASMRTMFETAMYYTYFRSHERELDTLVRDVKYYVDKKIIMEWHKQHTAKFTEKQSALGLLSTLDPWYKEISSIVHGQIPGRWIVGKGLRDLAPSSDIVTEVIEQFEQGVAIVSDLLLCTVAAEGWDDFTVDSRRELLRTIPKGHRHSLGLEKP